MEPMGGPTRQPAADQLTMDGEAPASHAGAAGMPLDHIALYYRTAREYVTQVVGFVRAGLAAAEPVMVAVQDALARRLRDELGDDASGVVFADATRIGGNPGRIIPAIHAFIESHGQMIVRYVSQPVRQPRSSAEFRETMRSEVLVNVAFAGQPVRVLCPYDAAALEQRALAEAAQAHPALMNDGAVGVSPAFDVSGLWPELDAPLPHSPPDVNVLKYRDDPGQVRRFVQDLARAAGLPEARITDLVLAVGELAANTLRHTREPGIVRMWRTGCEVICELADSGFIRDPLAGRLRPAPDAGRGHGLWVVHQVCDLVEMRTNVSGTIFRLHMVL
jgi:anti-sigma regulatory factor (Ser/Thr protein kinase)